MKLKNGLTGVQKYVAMGALAVVCLSSNVMAEEDAWFTALNTKLTSVQAMVGTVIGAIVAIYLVPIAWGFIKKALGR